jgi:hypothetical protein
VSEIGDVIRDAAKPTFDKIRQLAADAGKREADLRATVERLTKENAALRNAVKKEYVSQSGVTEERIATLEAEKAALTAKLAAAELGMVGVREAITASRCDAKCDSLQVRFRWLGDSGFSAGLRCNCWKSRLLAALPAPSALEQAIGAVVKDYVERGSVYAPLLDRLAALAPASWREDAR